MRHLAARLAAATAALTALLAATDAGAVPAFARRYGTSCQTCHVAYPKNTPFGEAFRRNGYRFPGGLEEDYRRDEPQKLGADGYKDVFPESVWPGELPGTMPLSLVLASFVNYAPGGRPAVDFQKMGGSIGANVAAPLGDWLAAWAGLTVSADAAGRAVVDLERVFLMVTPFEKPVLTLRAGRFEPALLSVTAHRTLGPSPWILTSKVGDDPLTLDPSQLGFELAGVFGAGRVAYALGLVEGAGKPANTAKDGYLRLAYKLGGLRLDGEAPGGEPALADPAPWREWSLLAGAFGYAGASALGDAVNVGQEDRLVVGGADLNAQLRDANLVIAYSYGRYRRPLLAEPQRELVAHQVFAQAEYVIFPWLVPAIRWERRLIDATTEDRLVGVIYALVRANVRSSVLFTSERGAHGFAAPKVQFALSLGL